MTDLGLPFAPAAFPVEFLALGGLGAGRAGARDRDRLRAAAARQGARGERDAGVEPRARVPLRRREGPAAARPRRPARAAHVPRLGRGQARARGDRRAVGGDRRRAAAVARRAARPAAATEFFGEPQLDVADLLRVAPDGRGVISCVELAAVQDKPALWSTALMWLVAELFEALPEAGDLPKPKLVVFLDEAHLLFDDATEAFLDSLARTVRLIRSKGVGVVLRHPAADRPSEEVLAPARPARPARAARVHARATRRSCARRSSTYPRSRPLRRRGRC